MESISLDNVVDLAAYREAQGPRSRRLLLLPALGQPRQLTPRETAHRDRMLRHFETMTEVSAPTPALKQPPKSSHHEAHEVLQ